MIFSGGRQSSFAGWIPFIPAHVLLSAPPVTNVMFQLLLRETASDLSHAATASVRYYSSV